MGLVLPLPFVLVLAAALASRPPVRDVACAHVALRAEAGRCDAHGCTLQGDAQLRCAGRWLRADTLRVWRDDNGAFAGAEARGAVTYVDGQQLVRAEALRLGADQVQGALHGATLVQFAQDVVDWPGAAAWTAGAAGPRRTLSVCGESFVRSASGAWRAERARLTLCDCGAAPPSWALSAAWVRVNAAGTRATAFWPVLRLHLWPGRTVPVTPPLPPVSVPLARRAVGLLPPRLQFLAPRAPTVDVPLFVPLGPSWDATLSLGVRPDWAASPRLAARLRGRPRATTEVFDEVTLTYDRRAPAQRLGADAAAPWGNDPAWRRARGGLSTRLLWSHRHEAWPRGAGAPRAGTTLALADQLRLFAEGQLASDNEVPRAFAVAPAERAAAYLPTRLWLQAANAAQSVQLQGEFYQRLEATGTLADGSPAPFAAGLRASSTGTVQRPLTLRWQLAARPLGHGLTFDAAASYALLATPWTRRAPSDPPLVAPEAPLPRPVHLWGATVGGGWRRAAGPWRLEARAGIDAVGYLGASGDVGGASGGGLASPLVRGRVALPLARVGRLGVHTLEPRLELLGVGALGKAGLRRAEGPPASVSRYDERLLRQPLLQGALGLRRALLGGGGRSFALDVSAPFDLRRGTPLRPAIAAEAAWPGGALGMGLGVSPQALGRGAWAAGLQDVAVDARQRLGSTTVSVGYLRLSPRAERLARTAYALAAPNAPAPMAAGDAGGEAWQHTLGLGIGHEAAVGFGGRYQAGIQLPRQNTATGGVELACVSRGGSGGRRACLTAHSATLSYASACHCWRVDALVSAAPRDFLGTFRFLVTLDVAGYRLGTQP